MMTGVSRSWWVFLVYGIVAVLCGIVMFLWPGKTVLALVWTFGVLSLADGVVSLVSAMRRSVALPGWLLVLYGLISIAFGVLAIMQPQAMASALLWVLALWLVIAGLARIVFAIQVRKIVQGEWLLALSGLLAIALGVLFFARPGVGLVTIALWAAIGAIAYGLVQIVAGFRLRRVQTQLI
ncbi:uncharacterized membrane protein HdeD (DUF308 family) [Luteimonas cucumeris]|uniref:Uncharacterized membrane protein HdeD (DUF308 family) n=2 Tax=Luteimonas cucumeris TaxID=985012 RepID=A0A562KUM3_9GAMM|nr:uncharacterized membrane protein HdeD (DUF308 family) [Luteimonas cucumeris]